ncbi:MAG: DEAD/DEAH box helicase [Clostridia bacterium]|nr:DEAD/DEAH box helicase [Clostridia bacterium]
MTAQEVLTALAAIRAPQTRAEYDLHGLVADALQRADIDFRHEAPLAPRCRIDFLCENVGIEIKRARPDVNAVGKQLKRYADSGKLSAIILLSEKTAPSLPGFVAGIPVYPVSLQKLWGIAIGVGEEETSSSTVTFQSENCSDDINHPNQNVILSEAERERSGVEGSQSRLQSEEQDPVGAGIIRPPHENPQSFFNNQRTEGRADHIRPYKEPSSSSFALEDQLLRDISNEDIPPFLRDGEPASYYYGTLSYNARRKCWTIKGDPAVTELAKRLFPGSDAKRGEARFTAHRRIIGDVNWLMLRYPLQIAERDKARWQQALNQARDYYREREKAKILTLAPQPAPAVFSGELRPFQQQGLNWLLLTPRALLADEMGLGKTVQALACAAMEGIFPLLIVPPPHLARNWLAETKRFLRVNGREPRVHIIKGLTPYPLPEADVYILHYLLLRGWKKALPDMQFHTVIFDEVQELRRTGTEKYSAASLLSESCQRVIGLSGTPIYNYGSEIWNVINILDYHFLGDWETFTREWCSGYGNRIVSKPELLGDHLRREGLMLRRTKQEVLPELPEKRRLVQEIDADDALYVHLMAPVWEKLYRWRQDQALSASARALLEDQISQEARQATGLAKAPYVCQFVKALVNAGEKVLLFAHHHAVMDIYKKELKQERPAFITGRESAAQKEDAVDKFMTGKTDLCVISLRAASGLNLQRATCVVFGELDWSPAVHSQAEDRAHRIGQKDSLLCYYLVSPGGSDQDMQEALGLKVSQFQLLMGDAAESQAQAQAQANFARQHVEKLILKMERRA